MTVLILKTTFLIAIFVYTRWAPDLHSFKANKFLPEVTSTHLLIYLASTKFTQLATLASTLGVKGGDFCLITFFRIALRKKTMSEWSVEAAG